MTQNKVLVKIAGRNEMENFPRILAEVQRLQQEIGFDLLLIDDGSTDGMADFVARSGVPHICHPACRGISAGHRDAMRWALDKGYDSLVTVDGDGQHDPQKIRDVIAALRAGANFAQCTRYSTPEDLERTPLDRRLLLYAVNGMLHEYVKWAPLTDPMCGFWGMDRATMQWLLPQLTQEGYAIQIEMVLRLWHRGELPPRRVEIAHPAIYENGTQRLDGLYTDERLEERLPRFGLHAKCILRVVQELGLDRSVGKE